MGPEGTGRGFREEVIFQSDSETCSDTGRRRIPSAGNRMSQSTHRLIEDSQWPHLIELASTGKWARGRKAGNVGSSHMNRALNATLRIAYLIL